MTPRLVLGGDRDSRALLDELVTTEVVEAVVSAIDRYRRDVIAIVIGDVLCIRDRAQTETDPHLPASLRWIRSAARGSWVVAERESDGARVRARMRMLPLAKGGLA